MGRRSSHSILTAVGMTDNLAVMVIAVIGAAPIADGFGVRVPKGYIYAATAFSTLVEVFNMLSRRAQGRSA